MYSFDIRTQNNVLLSAMSPPPSPLTRYLPNDVQCLTNIGTQYLVLLGGFDSLNDMDYQIDTWFSLYDLYNQQWLQGPNMATGRGNGFSCEYVENTNSLYMQFVVEEDLLEDMICLIQ
eukprot:398842_1